MSKRKFVPPPQPRPGQSKAADFKPATLPTPGELEAADAFAMGAK